MNKRFYRCMPALLWVARKIATFWFVLSEFYTSFFHIFLTHRTPKLISFHSIAHSVLIEFIIWILYSIYQNKSLCLLVLFCFVGWVLFCGFVWMKRLFWMKYLGNENKSNQIKWMGQGMFYFVLFILSCCFSASSSFFFAPKKCHDIPILYWYNILLLELLLWANECTKRENILTSWATYQIDVIHFYYANAIILLLDISVMIYIFSKQPQHI